MGGDQRLRGALSPGAPFGEPAALHTASTPSSQDAAFLVNNCGAAAASWLGEGDGDCVHEGVSDGVLEAEGVTVAD